MKQKESMIRVIAGVIVFAPIYASGLYFFADMGIDWLQVILVSVLWSIAMMIFENWWAKRRTNATSPSK